MTQKTALSVSELNISARELLENEFGQLQVEGEISNFTCAASGHWYFSLKDEKAQVSCAMFANANRATPMPSDGDKVVVRAKVSLYVARGNFQLLVESIKPSGLGQWQLAYQKLHNQLAAEGLFNQENKRPLPAIATCIGVISSLNGAALHDILQTLQRRFPAIPVRVYPSSVQGELAESELLSAFELVKKENICDVLLVARGGGSIEDLWSFNLESVARAIAASPVPVVSAVGHETDFTIADFVADMRASTPTAAAELVTPQSAEDLRLAVAACKERIVALQERKWNDAQQAVDFARRSLRHPAAVVRLQEERVIQLHEKLAMLMDSRMTKSINHLHMLRQKLHNLDCREVLKRGYTLAIANDNRLISSRQIARKHSEFSIRFHDGVLAVSNKDE